MPFMVIYRTSDGSSRYEQADAIDEAALFVERLRNSEGIDQIRIYRMEEISFAFRPYYKVELGLPERQSPAVARDVASTAAPVEVADAPAEPISAPDVEAVAHEPADVMSDVTLPLPLPSLPGGDDEPAGANGRRGMFGR